MKVKVLFLSVLILLSIFFHYRIKGNIYRMTKENLVLSKGLNSLKADNQTLLSEYSKLQSYERITSIAQNKLNMRQDISRIQHVENIYVNNKRQFTLVDYLVPKAEALTPK